jgi:hypothetical protein
VTGLTLLTLAVFWCASHLGLFVVLRGRLGSAEGAILKFHVGSFCIFAGLCAQVFLIADDGSATVAVGALAVHGIYSLSFLELWSLAEGGYSLQLLAALEPGPASRSRVTSFVAEIGDAKRETRIRSLESGGLIAKSDDQLTLTARGRLAVGAIAVLRNVAGYRDVG